MRRSYDRNWAWRIVELAMAGCAAGGAALSEREVQRQMLAEGKDVGKKYVRSCLTRFYESGDPHTTRDSDRRDPRRATETQRKWMKRLLKAEHTCTLTRWPTSSRPSSGGRSPTR
eukprot:COSAG01_NODE_2691_length_7244_cov_143.957465_5_plen_115_part_00